MLTDEQLRVFARDGFVVVPGVVPELLLAAADAELDALTARDAPPAGHTGFHFWFLPPGDLPAADAALRTSPALTLAEQLVLPHTLTHGLDHIQVALNIPPHDHRPGGPHIDGHRPEQIEPHSFTMLAAIYLVDETQIDSGNLWVWPGSHLRHQELFRERGVGALLPVSGHSTMLDGFDLPPPVPVYAQRGDLLLAHFLLGHNIGGNMTKRVRRILYYRLSCDGHQGRWADTFRDVWTEYAPVREVLR